MDSTDRGTRAARTPREDGKRHMVDAAIDLLSEFPPEQITTRDVAERAGHHHRFVSAWFDGKVGLFQAAFDQLGNEVARSLVFPPTRDGINPEVVRLVHLLNWLVANGSPSLVGPHSTPLIDRVEQLYIDQLGISVEHARLFAQRIVASAISMVLFAGAIGVQPADLQRHIAFELRLATLFTADQANPA